MRRRIYLMRHGEVKYFSGHDPAGDPGKRELTEVGRGQATAAGRALRGERFQRVVTSGLPRTMETAELVLAELATTDPLPRIEGWPDFEEFREAKYEDIRDDAIDEAFLPIFHGIPSREDRFLSGESVGSVVDRVNAAVDRFVSDEDWETALLVLHGGVNRAVLSRAITGERVFLGHIEQSPGCINIIDLIPGWFVRAVNITPLDPLHVGIRTTSLEDMAEDYRAYRGRGD